MTIQINYKNIKNIFGNLILFVNEKYDISGLKDQTFQNLNFLIYLIY